MVFPPPHRCGKGVRRGAQKGKLTCPNSRRQKMATLDQNPSMGLLSLYPHTHRPTCINTRTHRMPAYPGSPVPWSSKQPRRERWCCGHLLAWPGDQTGCGSQSSRSSRQRLGTRQGLFRAEVRPPPARPQEPYNVASEPASQYATVFRNSQG